MVFLDLELTNNNVGLTWDGSEKSVGMDDKLNYISKYMRNKYPNFQLIGKMIAQGEEVGDVYKIVMDVGVAIIKELF